MSLSSHLQLLCPFLFSQPGWREVPYDRPVVGLFILKLKEDDHKMERRRDRFERNYSFFGKYFVNFRIYRAMTMAKAVLHDFVM